MQTTLRARDNFAFNFAVEEANRLGQPVLVYHGLRADYPWASDRIHTFILESAADLASDFAALGVQYEFFLGRRHGIQAGESPLVELARRASLVVTDFFPTFIVPRQTARLRQILQASGSVTPVIAVDSSTVVPLAALGRPYNTARAIRPVLLDALLHHLHPVGTAAPDIRGKVEVPFTTPSFTDIGGLVASCPIDHEVAPSPVFRGGTAAARRQLEGFLERGLPRYDERSNPLSNVSSGLSPYLHFGNISPQEILLAAREAGPEDQYLKFRDQVLTWRELSFNFAYHDPRHREPESIPDWARRELDDHSEDPRPVIYTAEQLEKAATGDELWNAAQRQYLETGYMHNYLRMLWGKAVLQWTPDYRAAHRILVHLNNKYALDGRDPNSYAGIAWILGKFDRPFYRRPVYGLVRYMSLGAARKKFKLAPDPAKVAGRGSHQLVLPELTKHADR
jgi:deoxyribodipyrimidine photo-lyase